jgi:RimJ/RimL family protein N-acetyltransferase
VARLHVRDADKRADGHTLLQFRCSTGDEEQFWLREVEEFVRRYALPIAHHVLLFESESGELAGVTAFSREDISPSGRHRVAGWRLEVVALTPSWWGKSIDADIDGCAPTMKASEYLLRATFRRMLELDRRRVLAVARVHDDNRASMAACARVGLLRTERESDDYWTMLAEVDPAAGPG